MLCIALGFTASAAIGAENACEGTEAAQLLCPDFRVGPAADLYVEQRGSGDHCRTLLHAANDIRSRGRGPIELRGRRYKHNWMRANQAIYKVGGGVRVFRS